MSGHISRRALLAAAGAAAAIAGTGSFAWAQAARAEVQVWKDPNCGCCTGWVEHLKRNGLAVTVTDTGAMNEIKRARGVPEPLASCHTAEVGGYVLEGHVPAHAVQRLLAERPQARGLAVPGMPIGSPGMEGGAPEVYDVILFGSGAPAVFGRYREDRPV